MRETIGVDAGTQYVRGIGPRRAEKLERLDVHCIRDLLYFFPRKYHDRRNLIPIAQARAADHAMVLGDITEVHLHRRGRGRGTLNVTLRDETGDIQAVWFNQNYLADRFSTGDTVLMWGPVRTYKGEQLVSPGFEHVGADEHGGIALTEDMQRLIPVYPLTEGLSQGQIRPILHAALEDFADAMPEILPEALRARYKLPGIVEALHQAHFPDSAQAKDAAKRRLVYEEFLVFQLAVALRRSTARAASGIVFKTSAEADRRIRSRFPFQLTASQERALAQITTDMQNPQPMNRLLQGDVGCGKTVVALYAMLLAAANRYQSAIMAPTEILAEQHHRTITTLLAGARVRVRLLTGSSNRREVLADITRGEVDIVIGTHAVIQSDVAFHRLGLVVVDEQHKFGVMQRARLRWKGRSPDVLVMTATPIPRTLALTLFGDLDVSTITEMPPGRTPVQTRQIEPSHVDQAYALIREQVAAGRQAFVVCPLVEQSETLDLRSATETADHLDRQVFPEFRVGLLHGRMSSEEKDRAMNAFARGDMQIMVSTIVVEVGIDAPNATAMLILHADRFGLAQLHQLRGRIGRGPCVATCLLCADPKGEEALRRIQVMCETGDGFRIAEEDLRLRGTGELFGTRQHGLPDVRIGDFAQDITTLEQARDDAAQIVASDPRLEQPAHAPLRTRLLDLYRDRLNLIGIG